jgi:tetratricopeptide (TPR) repeat protein
MRSILRLALFFGIIFTFQTARAQSGDPSQMFLNAYMAVQQAEKLERNGKNSEALSKFRYAASLLDQITSQHPDWQPLIVNYRKKKTGEMIQKLEDTIALESPGRGPVLPVLEAPLPAGDKTPASSIDTGGPSSNVDSLEQATQEIRDRMRQLEMELAEQRRQVDNLQRDKKELLTRLSDAMQQVDKTHTKEAELRSQLTQTRTALENALSDAAARDARADLEDRVARLTEALQNARDESAVADEFARDLRNQIGHFRKVMDEKVTESNNERDNAIASRNEANAARDEAIASRNEAITARDEAIASRNEAIAERDEAIVTRNKAVASLNEAQTSLNEAVTARDEALAALEKSKMAEKQVETLKAENRTLLARLEEAEGTIKTFNADMPRKDVEIARLRQEVATAKQMLADAREESRKYQSSMADLRKQLDTANNSLAERKKSGKTAPGELHELGRENELLRGIVLRQLKEQARRDQAKKLVLAELANLEGKSEVLMNQIGYLGQPLVKLSEEERGLFKDPQVELPDLADNSALEISIAAPKQQKTEETPTLEKSAAGEPVADASPEVETAQTPNVPEELVPLAKEARELFDRSKYREAEKVYEKMQAKAPENIYILSNLGVVRFRSGKLRLAEEAFQKALAIDPNDSFSRCTLGIVFYQQGKYDEAIEELTRALAVDPKNATAHNYLGITASQKGWPEAAQKEMETAIQLDPNYADAYFNLSVIHATSQPPDRGEAKRYYEKALSLGAKPDPALENLLK